MIVPTILCVPPTELQSATWRGERYDTWEQFLELDFGKKSRHVIEVAPPPQVVAENRDYRLAPRLVFTKRSEETWIDLRMTVVDGSGQPVPPDEAPAQWRRSVTDARHRSRLLADHFQRIIHGTGLRPANDWSHAAIDTAQHEWASEVDGPTTLACVNCLGDVGEKALRRFSDNLGRARRTRPHLPSSLRYVDGANREPADVVADIMKEGNWPSTAALVVWKGGTQGADLAEEVAEQLEASGYRFVYVQPSTLSENWGLDPILHKLRLAVMRPGGSEGPLGRAWHVGVDQATVDSERTADTNRIAWALCDPNGALVDVRVRTRPRDETIPADEAAQDLSALIDRCGKADVVIWRDGRTFERDEWHRLRRNFSKIPWIEVIKKPPCGLVDLSTGKTSPHQGTSVLHRPGEKRIFVRAATTPQGKPTPTSPQEWRSEQIGQRDLLGLAHWACRLPSPDRHTQSLPIPVYWADRTSKIGSPEARSKVVGLGLRLPQ